MTTDNGQRTTECEDRAIPSIPFIVHKYNYTDNGQMWGDRAILKQNSQFGDSEKAGSSGKCCESFESGNSVEFGNSD